MGDFIYHYIRCIRQVRFEGSWHPNSAFPVRYDYLESVKIRIIKNFVTGGNSQCHGPIS